MNIEIKSIDTTDEISGVSFDPEDCCVHIDVEIGPINEPTCDLFYFKVVTTGYLLKHVTAPNYLFGRSLIVVDEFNWETVSQFISKLVKSIERDTWKEVTVELCKYASWEYENKKNFV